MAAQYVRPGCQRIGTNVEVEAAMTLYFVEGASGERRHSLPVPGPDATTSNSIVHDVHPTHPFLDLKVKPATQTLHPLEISEGITATDDNTDERESRQRVNLSTTRFSLTLCFCSSEARRLPVL